MPSPLPHSAPALAAALSDRARWSAVLARDASFDGRFYYSVSTTGIYCRPSCPARRPKRDHVGFHDSPAAAEAAGFRACKRCRPNEAPPAARHGDKIAQACRLIEASETPPSLAALAEAVGLSPYHFHRLFKAALGVTPSTFRAGGADEEIRYAVAPCSLGWVLVAASGKGVCAILLGDRPDALVKDLKRQFPRAELVGGDKDFEGLTTKIIAFVDAPGTPPDLPLDIRGTAFQHHVWETLTRIPAGATASYAEIAKAIGAPRAARAVARACAANKLAVAIPCHRVVRGDGSLSGYRWGVTRKRALLDKEKA